MKRDTRWFEGLKAAERVYQEEGIERVEHLIHESRTFGTYDSFDQGAQDYLDHRARLEEQGLPCN
jgi:hypothetical protein